jgi:hypothetical protein
VDDFLIAVAKGVAPALVAAVVGVGLLGARALGFVIAAGAFVGYGLLKRWPDLPHALWSAPDATQWWLWAVVAAALLGVLERARVLRGVVAEAVVILLGVCAVWLMLHRVTASTAGAERLLSLGVPMAALAVLTLGARAAAPAPRGCGVVALWTVCAVAASGVLTLGGSALFGQLAGAYAAALGASTVLLLRRRPVTLTAADASAFALGHGGLLIAGVFLAEVTLAPALLVGLAPLAAMLLRRPAPVLAWCATLTLAAIAIGLAFAGREDSGY